MRRHQVAPVRHDGRSHARGRPLGASQLARRVLEQRGHTVIGALDGQAGLDALADLAGEDLVLTDLTMPRMGGVEMAARIAATRPDIPVIFVSGSASLSWPMTACWTPRSACSPSHSPSMT